MDKNIYEMTYRELRDELNECYNNPTKKFIIRKLMKLMKEKHEYNKYIKRNFEMQWHQRFKKVQVKNLQKKAKLPRQPRNTRRSLKNSFFVENMQEKALQNGLAKYRSDKSDEELVNDLFFEIDKQENNIVPMNVMTTDSKYGKYDNKFKKEIKNDYVNNNLMARMDS